MQALHEKKGRKKEEEEEERFDIAREKHKKEKSWQSYSKSKTD